MKIILFFLLSVLLVQAKDAFYESLKMEQVNVDQLYGFFNFTSTWDYSSKFSPHHYNLFPRSIGQLILKYNIAEMHFTMTQGLWSHERWGYPHAPSPTGAQLWVWFHKDTQDIDKKWIGFTNALSGLFCASLNFMNKGITTSPIISFRPMGLVENGRVDNVFSRYAELGRENLCTENLTPWMKLLPCGSVSGPASLLSPRQLQYSRFLSIGLHFRHNCHGDLSVCNDPFVELQQHVSVVFDLRSLRTKQKKFSLLSLFGKKVMPACPIAGSSSISFKLLSDVNLVNNLSQSDDGSYFLNLFTLTKEANIHFKWVSGLNLPSMYHLDSIVNQCFISGIGLSGGLRCSISNYLLHNTTVLFFQVIPWYLHIQLHTLKLEYNGTFIKPVYMSYTPAVIREYPHCLELVLNLPASSVVDLQLDFSRGFLTWIEHPPDANHGFYISPSVITVQTSDLKLTSYLQETIYHVYSEALIVTIPVPDFSMPYNVICLVSTVVAISFGTFYNLTTKRLQIVSVSAQHPIGKIISKVLFFLSRKSSKSSST